MKRVLVVVVALLLAVTASAAERRAAVHFGYLVNAGIDLSRPLPSSLAEWQIGQMGGVGQWWLNVETRNEAPWADVSWRTAYPRYHDGVFDVVVWRHRISSTHEGTWCRVGTLSIPAAPGQQASVVIPSAVFTGEGYEGLAVEAVPGLTYTLVRSGVAIATAYWPTLAIPYGAGDAQPEAAMVSATCQ